ncbi:hypothetical protein AC578_9862 [Pseudocercospora eumusae]|uniref:Uncharacterized protein n=1 Tax=Pseudocercospora eumusae TaxID=321146 RepID=A0A139HB53_9PEZI|nr:hypothetical protein AC578_9862 [Pseudocercospora eumusae]
MWRAALPAFPAPVGEACRRQRPLQVCSSINQLVSQLYYCIIKGRGEAFEGGSLRPFITIPRFDSGGIQPVGFRNIRRDGCNKRITRLCMSLMWASHANHAPRFSDQQSQFTHYQLERAYTCSRYKGQTSFSRVGPMKAGLVMLRSPHIQDSLPTAHL